MASWGPLRMVMLFTHRSRDEFLQACAAPEVRCHEIRNCSVAYALSNSAIEKLRLHTRQRASISNAQFVGLERRTSLLASHHRIRRTLRELNMTDQSRRRFLGAAAATVGAASFPAILSRRA